MSQNLISAQLDPSALSGILETVESLKSQLDFLIDLNAAERRALVKMGDRSQAFVDRALEVGTNHRDILPGVFSLEEFTGDVALHRQLKQIQTRLSPLTDKLNDSIIASGSDAYTQALEVYAYAKAAGTGEGLDELRREMSRRFSNARTGTAEPTPEPA